MVPLFYVMLHVFDIFTETIAKEIINIQRKTLYM